MIMDDAFIMDDASLISAGLERPISRADWLLDGGATCHLCNELSMMRNVQDISIVELRQAEGTTYACGSVLVGER